MTPTALVLCALLGALAPCALSDVCVGPKFAAKGPRELCQTDMDCIDNRFLNYGLGSTISPNHVYYCLSDTVNSKGQLIASCQTIGSRPPGSICVYNQQCESGLCNLTLPAKKEAGYGICSPVTSEPKLPEGSRCIQRVTPFKTCDPKLEGCFTDDQCASGLICLPNQQFNPSNYSCGQETDSCTCKSPPKIIGAPCEGGWSCATESWLSGSSYNFGCIAFPDGNKTKPGCQIANDVGGACNVSALNVTEAESFDTPYKAGCLPASVCVAGKCELTVEYPPLDKNISTAKNFDCTDTKLCARGYACVGVGAPGKEVWNCTDVSRAGYKCDNTDRNSCGSDGSRVCSGGNCIAPRTAPAGPANRPSACGAGLQYRSGSCETIKDLTCTQQTDCVAYKTLSYCACPAGATAKCVTVPPPASCKSAETTKDMDAFCCVKKEAETTFPAIASWFNEAKAGWSCDESTFSGPFLRAMAVGLSALVLLLVVVGAMYIIRKRSPEGAGYKRIGGGH